MAPPVPLLEFYSHVYKLSDDEIDLLKKWSTQALPLCLACPGPGPCDLPALETVEISIVSDVTIAEIHDQFLNDPTVTDVITFQHGELLISYDTARREASLYDQTTLEELFVYVVHGLLHLNGHLDKEASEHAEMHRIQNGICSSVLKG